MATKTKDPVRPSETATPATSGSAGAPALTPEQFMSVLPADGQAAAAAGAPALQPPGTEAAGIAAQAAVAGVTATSATIGGLWTNNAPSNAWAYLNGVGWRKISPANLGAQHAVLQLARLAKDANVQVQCDEDGSVIHNMYVW
jgi:hypothetical protein